MVTVYISSPATIRSGAETLLAKSMGLYGRLASSFTKLALVKLCHPYMPVMKA
jgi:hypothetical protein